MSGVAGQARLTSAEAFRRKLTLEQMSNLPGLGRCVTGRQVHTTQKNETFQEDSMVWYSAGIVPQEHGLQVREAGCRPTFHPYTCGQGVAIVASELLVGFMTSVCQQQVVLTQLQHSCVSAACALGQVA